MGKCSGLKGGGHHRKALDVAKAKQMEKERRKQEQAERGKRAAILRDLLTNTDPNCDLYLDANGRDNNNNCENNNTTSRGDLCRSNFRSQSCTNKRCKFSHEHSIADALGNVISGTNSTEMDDGPATIPALRYLPGMLGSHPGKKPRSSRLRRVHDPEHDALRSPLELALSEGSSSVESIVECLESNVDVVHLGRACQHLYRLILDGAGCRDIQKRKDKVLIQQLERRNASVLATKAMAGSLRYAVSYFEDNHAQTNKAANRNRNHKKQSQPRLRPVLVFDFENPHVYEAFKASGPRKTYAGDGGLARTMRKDCTIREDR